MAFYDRVRELCKKAGTSPSRVAKEIGLSNSAATYWKNGSVPKYETIQKLAARFGVTADYLLEIDLHQSWKESFIKCGRPFGDIPVEELELFQEIISSPSLEDAKFLLKGYSKLNNQTQQLVNNYIKLNSYGKQKALERIIELTEIPRYQKAPPQDDTWDGDEDAEWDEDDTRGGR